MSTKSRLLDHLYYYEYLDLKIQFFVLLQSWFGCKASVNRYNGCTGVWTELEKLETFKEERHDSTLTFAGSTSRTIRQEILMKKIEFNENTINQVVTCCHLQCFGNRSLGYAITSNPLTSSAIHSLPCFIQYISKGGVRAQFPMLAPRLCRYSSDIITLEEPHVLNP